MSFRRVTIAAGAVAMLMTPVVARAASFTAFDNIGQPFSFSTDVSDNGDLVSINNGSYVGQASGSGPLTSQFTFSFTGAGVGSGDNTPQTDYFVTFDSQVVAEFTWTYSDGTETGVFNDFLAENAIAPAFSADANNTLINGTVDFAFDGFSGSINVPEPATLGVLGVGLAGLIGVRRRRA